MRFIFSRPEARYEIDYIMIYLFINSSVTNRIIWIMIMMICPLRLLRLMIYHDLFIYQFLSH